MEEVMSCDVCGEVIEPGQVYFNMPDGVTVCDDSDCLEVWAEIYKTRRL